MVSRFNFRAWFPQDHWYHQGMLDGWEGTTGVECLGLVPDDDEGIHVMQSTGLTDKNGVEIFEGDVLLAGHEPITGSVGWSEKRGYYTVGGVEQQMYMHLHNDRANRMTIIGNIHQNPELMEAQ
jgi:uncharacterized phage protein (TIGR01671 family)